MERNNYVLNCHTGRDSRDWDYPDSSVGYTPTSFTRRHLNPPVLDQGNIGSCVGMAGYLVFGGTEQNKDKTLSPLWIYHAAQRHDRWDGEDYSGTSVSGACKALLEEGACEEQYYPYELEHVLRLSVPDQRAVKNASQNKVHSYYTISFDRIDEIKELLKQENLWISIKVRSYIFSVPPSGIINEDLYMATPKRGGHAMALTGYCEINGELYWECTNSWSERWGNKGICYIPHSLMKRISKHPPYVLITNLEKSLELNKKLKKKNLFERLIFKIKLYFEEFKEKFFD